MSHIDEYIDTINMMTNTGSQLLSSLNLYKKYEKENKKELEKMTPIEVLIMLKQLNRKTVSVLDKDIVNIKKYFDWLNQKGIQTSNLDEITGYVLASLCLDSKSLENRILARSKLLQCLNELENPRDKFVLLGIFEGIRGSNLSEILELKPEDLYEEKGTCYAFIRGRGYPIEITSLLYDLGRESYSETILYNRLSRRSEIPLVDDGSLIKGVGEEKDSYKKYLSLRKRMIWLIKNRLDLDEVSFKELELSGIIHMIFKKSRSYDISPIQYVEIYRAEIERQYNKEIRPKKFIAQYRDYLE